MGRGLISAQVAISLLLLIGAGLFGRTLLRLYSIENGFDHDDVVLFSVNADRASLEDHALRSRILQELRSMPAVVWASFAMSPLSHRGWEASMRVQGYTHAPNENDQAHLSFVAFDYFKTLRTPLILGSEFGERDTETSPKVAVVNEAFARRYFREQSALGKWVNIAGGPDRMEIVGVAKDVISRSLRREVPPTVYAAVVQRGRPPGGVYIVRGNRSPAIIDTALKRVDARLGAIDMRTLEEHLSRSILLERMMGTLAGFLVLYHCCWSALVCAA